MNFLSSAFATAPEIATEAIPHCPICAGTNRTLLAAGHDYELVTCRNEWRFWQCADCDTVWLDPRPALETLPTIYPPHYYAYQMDRISPIALRAKAMLDAMKFKSILRHMGFEPQSFLDIGCGDGRYLDLFASRGISKSRIYGLELADEPVARLRQRGYQAFTKRVEDCDDIPCGSIDLATMFHVIEHVADPLRTVQHIAEWLSPHGCLVMETPNIRSLDQSLFAERWWGGYHIPRHWTLFSERSLRALVEKAGLRVKHVSYQTGHSFWMWSLHHRLKYHERNPSPRLANWFHPERNVATLAGFTALDKLRGLMGFRTSAILTIASKD